MIKKYSYEEGVPVGYYYLVKVETNEILFIAEHVKDLIHLCEQNKWEDEY